MANDIWKRDEIESPCVQVCVVHPETRLCIGCKRSIDEIAGWSKMSHEARRSVMDTLPSRTVPTLRKGGRKGRMTRGD